MAFAGGRHLQAVPDASAMERYQQDFINRTLHTIHLFNGVGRAERQVDHLLAQAKEARVTEAAEYLQTAREALAEAREALK